MSLGVKGTADGRVVFASLLLLVLPVAEFLGLRLFLHDVLQLRIGWRFTTDFDFLVPVPVSYCLLNLLLADGKPLVARFQKPAFLLNAVSFSGFVVLNLGYHRLLAVSPTGFSLAWLFCAFTTFVSAFFVFVPWQFYVHNPRRLVIGPCVFLGLSAMVAKNVFDSWWVSWGTYLASVLDRIFMPHAHFYFQEPEYVHILHPEFTILIGKGCAGFDGFLFFIGSILCFAILNRSLLNRMNLFLVTAMGLLLMWFLNVFRLGLLFFGGLFLVRQFGQSKGMQIFETIMHVNLGWVLYIVGVGLYLVTIHRILTRGNTHIFSRWLPIVRRFRSAE